VVWGRPGGLLQFFKGEAVKIFLHLFRLAFMQCGWTGRKHNLQPCASHCYVLLCCIVQHVHDVYWCGVYSSFTFRHWTSQAITLLALTVCRLTRFIHLRIIECCIEMGRGSVLPNFGRIIRPNYSARFGSATLCCSAEVRYYSASFFCHVGLQRLQCRT